jgi:hypothetical protein
MNHQPVTRTALQAAVVMLALISCSRKTEFSGIGRWSVTKTTLAMAQEKGVCRPTDLADGRKGTWCFGLPSIKVAGHAPGVDIYFLGDDKSAKPIEIQFRVPACDDQKLESWLETNFGEPIEKRTGRGFWKTELMFVAAMLPETPASCLLRLLPLQETAEIDRVKLL